MRTPEPDGGDESNGQPAWREELMNVLLKMEPAAFERLVQRLLRESGFIQVVDKLKEFGLGVQTKRIEVEQVNVDPTWFASI